MKKRGWQSKIKKACVAAGTYKPFFDYVIASLAGILEKRDEAAELLSEEEAELVISQTNKAGFTNMVKNPAYSIWDEMNKTALAYWRDLGLTPAGLKKINEEVFIKDKEEKNSNNLMQLLRDRKATNE